MAIAFQCVCGKAFNVADDLAGQTGTCPQCKMPVTVPGERVASRHPDQAARRFPREHLLGYFRSHQSSNVLLVHPHVPPAREQAARARFNFDQDDSMLAGLHPSLLLAGEETLIFTETGLYLKNADLTLGYLQYESLLEGSVHLEDGRDIVIQAVKPQRARYRILVSPGIADYLSRVLRGLQLVLNGRDPSPIFAGGDGNALEELRAERSGLLPSTRQTAATPPPGKGPVGLFGVIRRRR